MESRRKPISESNGTRSHRRHALAKWLGGATFAFALAGGGVLGVASSAGATTGAPLPIPVPIPVPVPLPAPPLPQPGAPGPVLRVDPTVGADLCGIGVGVIGVGTTSDCSGTPTGATGPGDAGAVPAPAVDVSPAVGADLCGIGVGVIGAGTTSECRVGSSNPTTANTSGSLVDVSPSVGAGVCGIGVGVIGTGSSSACTTASGGTTTDNGGSHPSGSGGNAAVDAAVASARPVGALAGFVPALAFTGGDSAVLALSGASLLALGGVLLRSRRLI